MLNKNNNNLEEDQSDISQKDDSKSEKSYQKESSTSFNSKNNSQSNYTNNFKNMFESALNMLDQIKGNKDFTNLQNSIQQILEEKNLESSIENEVDETEKTETETETETEIETGTENKSDNIMGEIINNSSKKNNNKYNVKLLKKFGYFMHENTEKDHFTQRIDIEQQIINNIKNKHRSSTILIGMPGSGKTALIAQLSLTIDKKILVLEWEKLLSNTMYRGQLETNLNQVLSIAQYHDIIVFIDEIHIVMFYKEWGLSDLLKPYLNTGNSSLTIIGATTPNEWDKAFKHDMALMRRFNQVAIPKLSEHELQLIIQNKLEYFKNILDVQYKDHISYFILEQIQKSDDITSYSMIDTILCLMDNIQQYLETNIDKTQYSSILSHRNQLNKLYEEKNILSDNFESNKLNINTFEAKLKKIKEQIDIEKQELEEKENIFQYFNIDETFILQFISNLTKKQNSQTNLYDSNNLENKILNNLSENYKITQNFANDDNKSNFCVGLTYATLLQNKSIFCLELTTESFINKSIRNINETEFKRNNIFFNHAMKLFFKNFNILFMEQPDITFEEYITFIYTQKNLPIINNTIKSSIAIVNSPNLNSNSITYFDNYVNYILKQHYVLSFELQTNLAKLLPSIALINIKVHIKQKDIYDIIHQSICKNLSKFQFLNIVTLDVINLIVLYYQQYNNYDQVIHQITLNIIREITWTFNPYMMNQNQGIKNNINNIIYIFISLSTSNQILIQEK